MTLETAVMIYITIALSMTLLGFLFTEFKTKIIQYQLLAIFSLALGWPIVLLCFLLPRKKEQRQ